MTVVHLTKKEARAMGLEPEKKPKAKKAAGILKKAVKLYKKRTKVSSRKRPSKVAKRIYRKFI